MPIAIVRDVEARCRAGKLKGWEERLKKERGLSCHALGEAVASMVDAARKDAGPDVEVDGVLFDEPVRKGPGRGHHGHVGRPGLCGGSLPLVASGTAGMTRRALALWRRGQDRKPGIPCDGDRVGSLVQMVDLPEDDILDLLVEEVEDGWRGVAQRIGRRAAKDRDAKFLGEQASAAWDRLVGDVDFRGAIDALAGESGDLKAEDLDRILAVGDAWVEAFVDTLVERRLVPQLESALSSISKDTADDVVSAIVEDVVGRVPSIFASVAQPMLRRLSALAKLTVSRKHEVVRKDPGQKYVVVTADDGDVCEVCEHVAEVSRNSKGFKLKDALALLFDLEIAGAVGMEDELPDFPNIEDIADLGVKGLTSMGAIVPPFHPGCRCEVLLS